MIFMNIKRISKIHYDLHLINPGHSIFFQTYKYAEISRGKSSGVELHTLNCINNGITVIKHYRFPSIVVIGQGAKSTINNTRVIPACREKGRSSGNRTLGVCRVECSPKAKATGIRANVVTQKRRFVLAITYISYTSVDGSAAVSTR